MAIHTFNPQTCTYTGPVRTPEELRLACPPASFADYKPPDSHLMVVKACNEPPFVQRYLESLRSDPDVPEYVTPLVIDDSKTDEYRDAIREVASRYGAGYLAVQGSRSVVAAFHRYLLRRHTLGGAELAGYLQRIVTDYPHEPSETTWGGEGGAQNVAHLGAVMAFGERGVAAEDFLATFNDHDLKITNAKNIFGLQGMYHYLGCAGLIASNYLGHSANPTTLTASALEALYNGRSDWSADFIAEEIGRIMHRVPTVGLRGEHDSDCLYGAPDTTLAFPTGNFSISGRKALEVAVPPFGMKDVAYYTILCALEELGVARVPDYIHDRDPHRETGKGSNGSVLGKTISDFYSNPWREREHPVFDEALRQYLVGHDWPRQTINNLARRAEARMAAILRQVKRLGAAACSLQESPQFAHHAPMLAGLTDAARGFGDIIQGRPSSSLEPALVEKTLGQIFKLHPDLVGEAYQFGAQGGLARV